MYAADDMMAMERDEVHTAYVDARQGTNQMSFPGDSIYPVMISDGNPGGSAKPFKDSSRAREKSQRGPLTRAKSWRPWLHLEGSASDAELPEEQRQELSSGRLRNFRTRETLKQKQGSWSWFRKRIAATTLRTQRTRRMPA